jgi:hypothetical protein
MVVSQPSPGHTSILFRDVPTLPLMLFPRLLRPPAVLARRYSDAPSPEQIWDNLRTAIVAKRPDKPDTSYVASDNSQSLENKYRAFRPNNVLVLSTCSLVPPSN